MTKRIAVIGAGFTGLTAAYELVKQGFSVTIFEKGNTIGGLAGGITMHGASIEKAYHHLFKTDTEIQNLIAEIGLAGELLWFDSKVGMVTREQGNFHMYPFNGAVDLLKYKPLSFFARLRAGLVTFFLQKYLGWKSLIPQTAEMWMKKWSGGEVYQKLWGPLLQGKFSKYANKISMAWLWARIHIRANSRKSIFEKEQLGYMRNGFLSIAVRLVNKIEEISGKVSSEFLLLNQSITAISQAKDGRVLIRTEQGEQHFDAVIGTIPTSTYAKLLPKGIIESKIEYINALLLVFSTEESLSSYYWHNIMDPEAPFLAFLQHTNLVPNAWYKGKHVYYIGAYIPSDHPYLSMEKQHIEDLWFRYLSTLFPNFHKNLVLEKHLFMFPHAQHIVDTTYEGKIAPFKLNMPGVYMATFSQIFPEDRGTNYAVRDGKKIASIVIKDLSK